MKPPAPISNQVGCVLPPRKLGFTLPELMVSITVFMFLIGGVLYAHLYGLTMFHITETTLNATDDARKAIGKMTDEIRTSNRVRIGNITGSGTNRLFSGRLEGETQQGSSLVIFPTPDTNKYVMYFVNPSDKTFRRTTSTAGSAVVVAETVTNNIVFCAQNHSGTVLTNILNNRVIHVNLEFYQPRRHKQVANYYKLETSVTRRGEEL